MPTTQSATGAVTDTGTATTIGAVSSESTGSRRLGLALFVIAAAQLMVVLDTAIVNVALPHMQRALGFSGADLEWVVNAYALTFGGLMLLGGRAGDVLGRKRTFIAGLMLFTAASLAGGLATSQAWLIAARAAQGAGAAVVAPTALALITTTFGEGKARNRAMGVYAAMSAAGGAIGLIAGGLLTSYVSWRWVLFVNVPIGAAMALLASRVLTESQRQPGPFDLPGAVTGTGGIAALVYGLSAAAPSSPDGGSHWGNAKVVAALAGAAVMLTAFASIELRGRNPLLPPRLLANRNRTGANLAMLCTGAALFGMFFFLTLFLQVIWGYSPLKAGLAYLPMTAAIGITSGAAAQLTPRIGARPVLLAGTAIFGGGLYWLSRLSVHGSYLHTILGPTLTAGAGLGLLFVPLTVVAMAKVSGAESGVAASLRNTSQQAGGSIGLAVLSTIAFTAAASHHHALAAGFARGFEVAAGIMLIALIITAATIRIHKADVADVNPT